MVYRGSTTTYKDPTNSAEGDIIVGSIGNCDEIANYHDETREQLESITTTIAIGCTDSTIARISERKG